MAALDIRYPLRPCFVNGEKALFHIWTEVSDPRSIVGIIELMDGSVKTAEPTTIRFVDTDDYLGDIVWD